MAQQHVAAAGADHLLSRHVGERARVGARREGWVVPLCLPLTGGSPSAGCHRRRRAGGPGRGGRGRLLRRRPRRGSWRRAAAAAARGGALWAVESDQAMRASRSGGWPVGSVRESKEPLAPSNLPTSGSGVRRRPTWLPGSMHEAFERSTRLLGASSGRLGLLLRAGALVVIQLFQSNVSLIAGGR